MQNAQFANRDNYCMRRVAEVGSSNDYSSIRLTMLSPLIIHPNQERDVCRCFTNFGAFNRHEVNVGVLFKYEGGWHDQAQLQVNATAATVQFEHGIFGFARSV